MRGMNVGAPGPSTPLVSAIGSVTDDASHGSSDCIGGFRLTNGHFLFVEIHFQRQALHEILIKVGIDVAADMLPVCGKHF